MWANWAKCPKCPQHKCDPKVPSAADASSGRHSSARFSAASAGRTLPPRGKSVLLLADLRLIRCGPPRVESNLLYSVYDCERSSHLKNMSQQGLDQHLTQSLATVA